MTETIKKAPEKTPDEIENDQMQALVKNLRKCGSSLPDLLHRIASQQIGNYPPPPEKAKPKVAPPVATPAVEEAGDLVNASVD